MSKKYVFNDDWLSPSLHPSYSSLVQKVDCHNTKALCSIYRKTFNLSNMGHRALLSHEQSENHKKNVKSIKVQPPMNAFFKKSENSAKGSSENQSS